MTTATTDPLTHAALNQFLSQLTDEQKRYVMAKLLPPFMESLPGLHIVYNEKREVVGDLVPVRRVQPGEKVTMSDEARAALANTVCKTRAQWEAERAGRTVSDEEPR